MSKLLDIFNKHCLKAPFSRTKCIAEIIGDEGAIDELNEKTDFLAELDFSNIAMEAIGRHFLMVLEKAASDYINVLRDGYNAADCVHAGGGFELMQIDADEIADVLYEGPDDEDEPIRAVPVCCACNNACSTMQFDMGGFSEDGGMTGRKVTSSVSACCRAPYRMEHR